MKEAKIHPDAVVDYNYFRIYPDGDTVGQELANLALSVLPVSRHRFRMIVSEDRVVEVLFTTQEQAMRAVDNLAIGEDGNFHLPT